MKVARLFGILAAAMFLVPLAKADGPVTMTFNGVNGANDGQYYVSPYFGTMGTQPVVLFCDDILNDVNFNQTWQADVTNLGTAIANHDFSQTRYGSALGSAIFTNTSLAYYNNPGMAYEEAAWLVSQFATNPGDLVNLQYALWDIMNPGARGNGNLDVQGWLALAAANYTSINPYNFDIITNCNPTLQGPGQVQEFIIQTPEPGTLALLICGLLALAVRLFNRGRLTN
jgi:hypothetical protein